MNWGLKMTRPDQTDDMLDALFDAARGDARADASPDLMARVLADAEAALAENAPAERPRTRGGLLSQLFALLGGWPALGGLAAATLAGVWIGISAETLMPAQVSTLIGTDSLSTWSEFSGGMLYALEEG